MNSFLLSLVVPVFNEEKVLPEFFDRTASALSAFDYEVIFVDDGSRDDSWPVLERMMKKSSRVRAVRLSRNFGHQAAITAGLEHAAGDAVVVMDADLQDPPEVIPAMVARWQEGYDVVYGTRAERRGESWFKKVTAGIFYRFLRRASPVDLPREAGDFRLMSRAVVNSINSLPERIRYMRGLTSWVGFRQVGLPYTRDPRFAGETKYPLGKMLRFAWDGITSFTRLPLQLAIYLGLMATGLSLLYAFHSLYVCFVTKTAVKGWTSLIIAIVFLGGVQLLMIGIIGEYIGRIYEEVKHRPLYLVRQRLGFPPSEGIKKEKP
ncbi:MAG: glycosyltransferase family 2 protein [Candidatus Omnitrophota bacterium]|jgi:dolichol-phosphate mannosyltransferase